MKPRLRYCLLLRVAATSCWITQEPLGEEGASTPRGMGKKQDICEDTKTQGEQGNRAVSWAGSKGTEKLWSPLWNVLSLVLSFPIYAVKKTHTIQNTSCWLSPGTVPVCRPRCLFAPHPNITQQQCWAPSVLISQQPLCHFLLREAELQKDEVSLHQNRICFFPSLCSLITRPKHLCSKHSPGDHFALDSEAAHVLLQWRTQATKKW